MPVPGSTTVSLGWRRLIETLVRLAAGVGLILANDFFVTTEFAVDPVTVGANLPMRDAIDRFQEARQELAFVMEGDRLAGILTSTDALGAIAGELRDPFD